MRMKKNFRRSVFCQYKIVKRANYHCLIRAAAMDARLNALLGERVAEQNHLFKQHGIDVLDVRIDQSFMNELVCFFRRRMMY